MQKLLIGTKNPGKIREYKDFFKDLPLEIVSLSDIGIDDDVEEKGKTYKENAQLKALFYAKKSNLPTISDDGGIEIDAFGGAPGIKSHRWLGYEMTDAELIEHMKKVSRELDDNNRHASFKLVIAFALSNGRMWTKIGTVDGIISENPNLKPLKGYPFRSFFFLPDINKHYHESELTAEEMREYNHRYKAVVQILPIIKEQLV